MATGFEFTAQGLPHDYHSPISVTLQELIDCGFVDWSRPEWKWDAYDDEQYARVCSKFDARYGPQSVGILPLAEWRRQVVRKFNEAMPKYRYLYARLADGFDPFQSSDTWGKSREVYSDFPATLLGSENEDYAAHATDRQDERVTVGDVYERYVDLAERLTDVDVMLLDEMDVLFSSLITVSVNGL